jgi:hypothetical protein
MRSSTRINRRADALIMLSLEWRAGAVDDRLRRTPM